MSLSNKKGWLGQTGIEVSCLGFGAAPIGNLYHAVANEDAYLAVQKALQLGVTYFDTAPFYGMGVSETRLGEAFGEHLPKVVLSSKVGRLLQPMADPPKGVRYGYVNTPALMPEFDYSYDGVMKSVESSLKRLQCNHIHLLLAHDLGLVTHSHKHAHYYRQFLAGGYLAMRELRESGVVDAIGIGANEWQVCSEALDHADFDCFLLAGRYTLLDHKAAMKSFLPQCVRRKVTIVLGGPFNSGILATGVKHPPPGKTLYYDYLPASQKIMMQVDALESVCDEFQVPLAAAALQFPTAHSQICSVLAGFANAAQVEQAYNLMNSSIPAEFWQALKARGLLDEQVPTP